jgi:hypothetical protein
VDASPLPPQSRLDYIRRLTPTHITPTSPPGSRRGGFFLARTIPAHIVAHVGPIPLRVRRTPALKPVRYAVRYGVRYGSGLVRYALRPVRYAFRLVRYGHRKQRTASTRTPAPQARTAYRAFIRQLAHNIPASLKRCRACASMRALRSVFPRPRLCQCSQGFSAS